MRSHLEIKNNFAYSTLSTNKDVNLARIIVLKSERMNDGTKCIRKSDKTYRVVVGCK